MVSSKLKNYLTEMSFATQCLSDLLNKFSATLSREADAIGRSDIVELEKITAEKVAFGESVGLFTTKIQNLSADFIFDYDPSRRKSMSNTQLCLDFILKIVNEAVSECSEASIEQYRRQLELDVDILRQARIHIFPKIESNAYMVKKLLQYHRETYAFWQSIAGESEAVYGQSGKAKVVQQRSILTVRT